MGDRLPAPVLEVRTQNYGDSCSYAGASHARLQNSAGQAIVFPVPALQFPSQIYNYDCAVGDCHPGILADCYAFHSYSGRIQRGVGVQWGG